MILAWAISSSIVQPLFGLWSDRRGALWLLPAGVALGGNRDRARRGRAELLARPPARHRLGPRVAAYHPEGSKFAAYVSGRGARAGCRCSRSAATSATRSARSSPPPLVVALGLAAGCCSGAVRCGRGRSPPAAAVPRGVRPEPGGRGRGAGRPAARDGAPARVIALRSVAWFGLLTFVPLWEVSLGHSRRTGTACSSLMLLVGGIGTLVAGPAADRFGRRPVLTASTGRRRAADPRLHRSSAGSRRGRARARRRRVIGTFGVTMVMSQEYMPRHIGMASGPLDRPLDRARRRRRGRARRARRPVDLGGRAVCRPRRAARGLRARRCSCRRRAPRRLALELVRRQVGMEPCQTSPSEFFETLECRSTRRRPPA